MRGTHLARVFWIVVALSACALVLAWNVTGEVAASNGVNTFSQNLLKNFPTPPTWIDDATGGKPAIYLGQQINDPQGIWLMEFWNRGLSYVWSLDGTAPPPGRLAPGYVTPDAQPDGTLVGKSIPQGNPPGVGRWTRSASGLVITEEGRDYKTDVVALTADRASGQFPARDQGVVSCHSFQGWRRWPSHPPWSRRRLHPGANNRPDLLRCREGKPFGSPRSGRRCAPRSRGGRRRSGR